MPGFGNFGRDTQRKIAEAFKNRKVGVWSNMSATRYVSTYGDLYLHPEAKAELKAVESEVEYVVYSYATPIAWVTKDGTVTIPNVRYSQTTTGHQRMCRLYLVNNPVPTP